MKLLPNRMNTDKLLKYVTNLIFQSFAVLWVIIARW